ncbi:SRPBCC family protein [Aliikangiella sp. IMCC44359]|uniref:SRPBCC family protein n=1 Tax=Aliikangiella sp. IMCC44359 TaxID=3459125 RepID=UPI00403B385A
MRTFLKIIGVLIILFIIGGLILDNKVNVTREIEIQASPEKIHLFVNDLNQWPQWTPWIDLDPTIKTTIGAVTHGVGAMQSWTGESGSGSLTFTQSSPENGIVYDLTFEGDPTVYISGMRYSANGDKTIVTWYMTGEMQPIIIGNYFAQLMDVFVGDSFSSGLNKLKKAVESSN